MQTVGAQLTAVLQARDRDLITVYELYASDYQPTGTHFDPRDAEAVFSGVGFTLPFGPVVYRRQVLQGPNIRKTTGKEFNSATIRFSNLAEDENGSRWMAQFVLNRQVEQMRLVVRVLSRSVTAAIGNNSAILGNSDVLFVGRCGKPDGFNRSLGTISAKPDMGTVEARMPPRLFQASCPLEFKGPECLGYELLSEKSAEYQAAVICNKQRLGDCTTYQNTEFFQGVDLVQIESSFVHKSNESFFKKVLNIFPGISRKKTTVNNSLYDSTPYGNPIPLIFGRWYKVLIPLQYQDIGNSINFRLAACRGKISDFINIRNLSLGFTQPIGVTKFLGEYGGEGSQVEDTIFQPHGFFSRLAKITGYCNGSDIETSDPAPEIAAVIAGTIPEQIYFDVDHDGTGKLSLGSGGVTAAGSSTTSPGTPAATYDDAVLPKAPLLYAKLHENCGGFPCSILDDSGNGNIGLYNDPAGGISNLVQRITHPIETDLVSFGCSGAVGQFNASSGSALDMRGDQTWEAWAKMTDTSVSQSIMINRGGDVSKFFLSFGTGLGASTINATFGGGSFGSGPGVLSWEGPVVEEHWYHVVLTRQGSVLSLYVDGCLADRRSDFTTDPIVFSDYNNSDWRIGYLTNFAFGAVFLSQGVSHVALYDFAFTEEQVRDNHASGRLTPTGCPGEDWTDNPVDFARHILTEPSLMGNDDDSIDDYLSAYAAAYNCGAIKDDTNAERCLLPNTEITKAGVDYKRYNSTGLLTPESFQSTRTQIPAGVPAHECDYEFYDPAAPPDSLDDLADLVVYRKRFTCNIEISEVQKAVDVLYDKIFPTFNGFLRWNTRGQTIIDSARPADWTTMRVASIAGATTITVQDVLPWKSILGSPYLLEGKVHLDRRISYVFDNAAIRTAVPNTPYVAADVGKYALQKDTNTIWRLTATTPTWLQITSPVSEVRPVILAQYSALGDAVTLAASASGGPSAVASGGTLSGGSTTVQSSATVTITGSLAEDATITVTIDGVDCILTLLEGETSATIGHRMACVINATPVIQEYVEAHAVTNVVTVKAKVGVLTLASALEEAHDAQTEVTRVLASFAGKALTYADTTRANILDGTFNWPDAGRQSLVNQTKAEYRESVRDFGKQPIVVNDYNHQRKTRKVNTFEIDHSAIDNYNQSARLSNGLLNRLRDGDEFYEWASMGEALLLDESDVVCVSDDSGPFRNQLCRIEDINISSELRITFNARKYSRLQLSDLVAEPAGLLLASALTNFEQPPPVIAFNETGFPPDGLTQSTDGTAGITSIRGGLIFGASIYTQWAKVRLIRRGGITVDESINDRLEPNSDLEGAFEFIASTDGLYTVQAQACNQWGCSIIVTADIVIGFGSLFAIAKEGGVLLLKEGGTIMEKEHA